VKMSEEKMICPFCEEYTITQELIDEYFRADDLKKIKKLKKEIERLREKIKQLQKEISHLLKEKEEETGIKWAT